MLFNIQLEENVIFGMVFIVNFIMSAHYLFNTTYRAGVDYSAYIQQASAVYNGETDYSKISSN